MGDIILMFSSTHTWGSRSFVSVSALLIFLFDGPKIPKDKMNV